MLYVLIFYFSSLIISQPFFSTLKYYQARFFSLLLLTLASYLFSFVFPFKYVFYIFFTFFIVVGIYVTVKNGLTFKVNRDEFVFLIVFIYFLLLRALVPDIFGAEKFMDMAFINSILKSYTFPPNDPYFAGGKLNVYYYFGHVIGAAITLMSFTKSEIGYNIAIAAIPAFSSLIVFGFLKEFVKNVYAALGSIFILFSGNLYAAMEFFYKLLTAQSVGFLFYWNATRIIKDSTFGYAITEFPYFSFIHADLHAHVVAIPITILTISILYDFYKGNKLKGYLLPILLFILFATNPWNVPTLLLLTATIFLTDFKYKKELLYIILVSSMLISLLYINMKNASSNLGIVTEKTSLLQFIEFFGIQIAFAYYYFFNSYENHKKFNVQNLILVLVAAVSYIFIPIGVVLIPLIILSLKKTLRGDYLASLILTGCVTILSTEIFMIDCRMNTIFKFYLVSWLLLTIPAATKLRDAFELKTNVNKVMLVLFVLSLIYPTIATPARHYKAEMSLDGLKFMEETNIGDYNAIYWLRNKDGNIVEAVCDCYTYCSRISTFSGNPTIIAWPCHEVHWRGNVREIVKRINDVKTIYTSKTCSKIVEKLKEYDVKYVVVGNEERRIYKVNEGKFKKCGLKKVFESEGTSIFYFKSKN